MAKSKDEGRREFLTEPLSRQFILDRLSSQFKFWREVKAINAIGDKLSIDAVSRCCQTGYFIGWEFKRSPLYKKEFASALRQAIHYRLARITDTRLPELADCQLPGIAVFPDWDGRHDEDDVEYGREADGMRLLAGQFRVGVMRRVNPSRVSFIMHEGALWHSDTGWTGNAEGVLFGKRPIGAVSKLDR